METLTEPPKRKRGRPCEFTAEIGEEICQRIAGGETIVEICGSDGMPAWETLRRWLLKYPDFQAQYARAREFYSEYRNDQFRYEGKINPPTTPEGVANRRIELDHMKWELSKHAPKKYGDKIAMEHEHQHKFIPLDELTERVQKIQLERSQRVLPAGEKPMGENTGILP